MDFAKWLTIDNGGPNWRKMFSQLHTLTIFQPVNLTRTLELWSKRTQITFCKRTRRSALSNLKIALSLIGIYGILWNELDWTAPIAVTKGLQRTDQLN